MNISNDQLRTMLATIPDPKMRREISDIATGQVTHEILCLSEDVFEEIEDKKGKITRSILQNGCKGRTIAKVYSNGKVQMVESDGKYWLRSSRDRFDGNKGFQCWCGNDSLLAKQEIGHIGQAAPDRDSLNSIWQNLQSDPNSYPTINGEKIIDGFMIREIA